MKNALFAKNLRLSILQQSRRAYVGHIGSALSVVEILTAIYNNVINIKSLADPERDRFILSKGHAALALYAVFFELGWLSQEQLNTYCGNATLLGVHPEHHLPGVDFSTGSLGQGLSVAAGCALAAKLSNSPRKVYAVVSDAECNEGSTWEAIMFAAHHKLNNLVVIVDDNKQQALGYTKDVLAMTPLAERWQVFGWDTHVVDGHNVAEMVTVLENFKGDAPHVLLAQTTFGKGVSFMHNKIAWHYLPLEAEQYESACAEINADYEAAAVDFS